MSEVMREFTYEDELLVIPRHFKAYEVLRTIGYGCSAVVVEVRDVNTKETYAAKVLPHTVQKEPRHVFFERELGLCTTIMSQYLVNVREVVRLDKITCIVMEYSAGGDLSTKMDNDLQCVQENRKAIFKQICLGVEYLHVRGIAHCDIKPENVLLTGDGYDVKLCDYGFLCEVGESGVSTAHSGTLPYMAPEVAQSQGAYCPKKADIWALGILLYYITMGNLPFKLPADTIEVVLRCCDPNPEMRLTITELLAMPFLGSGGTDHVGSLPRGRAKHAIENIPRQPRPCCRSNSLELGGFYCQS